MPIETFEELEVEVKKLYSNSHRKFFKYNQDRGGYELFYEESNPYALHNFLFSIDGNPQKIYNYIKALKNYEECNDN